MQPQLPRPVGPISENAFRVLHGRSDVDTDLPTDPFDLDAQLAWFELNEVSFAGWRSVDDGAEWWPEVVRARQRLEAWFVRAISARIPDVVETPAEAVSRTLSAEGPSISSYLRDHGTVENVRESLMLRFPYQSKEADPHAFAVPRLSGGVKRALCDIQSGEYGVGHRATHAELFRSAVEAIGVETDVGAVLERLPGVAFATSNLVSMGGLNRSRRGIVVGQLALFEMDSVIPSTAMVAACRRLDLAPATRRFFEVHVMADAEHEKIAEQAFLHGYPSEEPGQIGDVVFGIRAQSVIDRASTDLAIGRWTDGRSALRASTPHARSARVAA